MIRLLVADDHTLVREGLKQILAAAPDVAVADEAVDGDQTLAKVRGGEFDLVLLDMSMPGVAGIELIRRLKLEKPKLRILVLSMHGEQQYAARAYKAGASGYLTKDGAASELIGAIRRIAAGGVYISPAAAERLALDAAAGQSGPRHTALSDREFEVFRMLVAGRSVGDIADRLNLSAKTVSTHKTRIQEKMALRSTAELVRYAIEHNLLDGTPPT